MYKVIKILGEKYDILKKNYKQLMFQTKKTVIGSNLITLIQCNHTDGWTHYICARPKYEPRLVLI